jgi:hypothetical protein
MLVIEGIVQVRIGQVEVSDKLSRALGVDKSRIVVTCGRHLCDRNETDVQSEEAMYLLKVTYYEVGTRGRPNKGAAVVW